MSTSLTIRTLLAGMDAGQTFTTGDFFGVGSRAAIDQCLHRMVNAGHIIRLANGVFAKPGKAISITAFALAQIKARAFHKEVFEHGAATAQRLGYTKKTDSSESLVFATNGTGRSRFKSVFGTIELRAVSARKRAEHNDEVWEVLKSLWHLGKQQITPEIKARITIFWRERHQQLLQSYSSTAPQWLRDQFPRDVNRASQMVYQNVVPYAFERSIDAYHESVERKATVDGSMISPGFSVFEPPEREFTEHDRDEWSKFLNLAPTECSCPAGDDECICPEFNCIYCQSRPVNNKFRLSISSIPIERRLTVAG